MRDEYIEFISGEEWREIRKAKLRNCGRECEKCYSKENIQVHHRHYDDEYGMVKEKDLMVLCKECHDRMHQDIEMFKDEIPDTKIVVMENRCDKCKDTLGKAYRVFGKKYCRDCFLRL